MNNDDRLSSGLNIDMCIEQIESKMSDDIIMQQIYISLCAYKIEIEKLKEENERLKEIEKFKFSIRKDETKIPPIVTKNYKREYEDYKSRNEKAIEYIKNTQKFNKGCDINIILNKDYLLKILGGYE